VPDFQVIEGQLVPEMYVLYGLTATGQFSQLLRFEAAASERGLIALAELVEAVLEDLQTSAAGFVIAAETDSLVGDSASLPSWRTDSHLRFRGARLAFLTTEPTNEQNLASSSALPNRNRPAESAAFLHRIGQGTNAGPFPRRCFPIARSAMAISTCKNDRQFARIRIGSDGHAPAGG
jgi:hypothetical protein